jgi:hypothetical protein
MTVSKLSLAVAENAVTDKMDELDELLTNQIDDLKALRESLINYMTVTEQIIKELGNE